MEKKEGQKSRGTIPLKGHLKITAFMNSFNQGINGSCFKNPLINIFWGVLQGIRILGMASEFEYLC